MSEDTTKRKTLKWLPGEEDLVVQTFPCVPNTSEAKKIFENTPPRDLRKTYLKYKLNGENKAVAVWKTKKKGGEETSYKMVPESYLWHFYHDSIDNMARDPKKRLPEDGRINENSFFDHRILSLINKPPPKSSTSQESKTAGKANSETAPKRHAQDISTSISTVTVDYQEWEEYGPKLKPAQLPNQVSEITISCIIQNVHSKILLDLGGALSLLSIKDVNQYEMAKKLAPEPPVQPRDDKQPKPKRAKKAASEVKEVVEEKKASPQAPKIIEETPAPLVIEIDEETRKSAEVDILPYIDEKRYVPCIGHPIWVTLDQDRLMLGSEPEMLKQMRDIQKNEISQLNTVEAITSLDSDRIELIHALMDSVYEIRDMEMESEYIGVQKVQKQYVHDPSVSITYERAETKLNGHCVKRTVVYPNETKSEFIYCDFGKKDPNKKQVILAMMVVAYVKGSVNTKVSQDLMQLSEAGSTPPEYIENLGMWILALYDYLFGRAIIAKPKG